MYETSVGEVAAALDAARDSLNADRTDQAKAAINRAQLLLARIEVER